MNTEPMTLLNNEDTPVHEIPEVVAVPRGKSTHFFYRGFMGNSYIRVAPLAISGNTEYLVSLVVRGKDAAYYTARDTLDYEQVAREVTNGMEDSYSKKLAARGMILAFTRMMRHDYFCRRC